MSDREKRIVKAAFEWLEDRTPRDVAEIKLALALAKNFPEQLTCRSTCDCGEQDECDECAESPTAVIIGLRKMLRAAQDKSP